MKLLNQYSYAKKQNIILAASIIIHTVFFILNLFIGGYNCDEAMTILNAKSLVRCGTDIMGEKLPVYFDTWLYGGQSPMATYAVALSIKIFGENYFAYRFPIFIMGIIGLFALKIFLNEVFIKNNKKPEPKYYNYIYIILILASFSPWHIFSCTYMFDCNFLPHFMMIAMMFLAKAVNQKSNKLYYAASMVFFGLGFYCYIASALIIPVFLAVFFLTLIIKKKIPLSCIITSALTIFIVSLPFILFGLVTVGAVKPFSLFGFSFSDMPYYNRANSLTFSGNSGILSSLKSLKTNFIHSLLILVCPDLLTFDIDVTFTYTNFIGGFIMAFGALAVIVKLFIKRAIVSFQAKLFALCSVITLLSFCILSKSGEIGIAYRFGTLFYMLILIEGIGFAEIGNLIKKINIKKIASIFMAFSFVMFTYEYAHLYVNDIKTETTVYGDSLYDCISFVEEDCNADNYTVAVVLWHGYAGRNERQAVFLKSRYNENFNNFDDILKATGLLAGESGWSEPLPQLTKDNSVKYQDVYNNPVITDDYNIIYTSILKDVEYNKDEYSVKDFGLWSVIYRTE